MSMSWKIRHNPSFTDFANTEMLFDEKLPPDSRVKLQLNIPLMPSMVIIPVIMEIMSAISDTVFSLIFR